MSKIIVDSIQTTGGTAFGLPAADGTAGSYLSTDGSGALSWAAAASPDKLPPDSHKIVGTVLSGSSREQVYSTGEWSSSGPWTTYYNSWSDTNSRIQGINMFMGDGYASSTATTQSFYINDGMHNETRKLEFAHNNRVGHSRKDYFEYDNQSSQYAGIHIRALPVRNTTASAITRNADVYASAYNNDYGGAAYYSFVPDAEAYSAVTGGTWTDLNTSSQSNTDNNFGGTSVTFPANKTTILFLASATRYETTYRMKSTNQFYNLNTLFPNTDDLVCDLRMLYALAMARIPSASHTTDTFFNVYPTCAAMYGDR
jgi:hypothetical protein